MYSSSRDANVLCKCKHTYIIIMKLANKMCINESFHPVEGMSNYKIYNTLCDDRWKDSMTNSQQIC